MGDFYKGVSKQNSMRLTESEVGLVLKVAVKKSFQTFLFCSLLALGATAAYADPAASTEAPENPSKSFARDRAEVDSQIKIKKSEIRNKNAELEKTQKDLKKCAAKTRVEDFLEEGETPGILEDGDVTLGKGNCHAACLTNCREDLEDALDLRLTTVKSEDGKINLKKDDLGYDERVKAVLNEKLSKEGYSKRVGACLYLAREYGMSPFNAESGTPRCVRTLKGCPALVLPALVADCKKENASRKEQLELDIKTASEEIKDLQKQKTEIAGQEAELRKNCPQCFMLKQIEAQADVAKTGMWLGAGVGALGIIGGALGSYWATDAYKQAWVQQGNMFSQFMGAYPNLYQQQLSQCVTIGVPCAPPFAEVGGMFGGGGFGGGPMAGIAGLGGIGGLGGYPGMMGGMGGGYPGMGMPGMGFPGMGGGLQAQLNFPFPGMGGGMYPGMGGGFGGGMYPPGGVGFPGGGSSCYAHLPQCYPGGGGWPGGGGLQAQLNLPFPSIPGIGITGGFPGQYPPGYPMANVWMNPGAGGIPGSPGYFNPQMNMHNNPQYQMMMQAQLNSQQLNAQRAYEAQQNLMIGQQQMMEAQARYNQAAQIAMMGGGGGFHASIGGGLGGGFGGGYNGYNGGTPRVFVQ